MKKGRLDLIHLPCAVQVAQEFCYYESSTGDNDNKGNHSTQASGAYIFRPKQQVCTPIHTFFSGKTDILAVVKGPIVSEIRQQFAPWLTQTVRLGKPDKFATFEFTVGEVPLLFNPPIATPAGSVGADPSKPFLTGKEIVSRFTTSIASNGELLTDSNGREMLVRRRNYRPTWALEQTEPVAGNYFPCNSATAIRDGATQMTVLVDRSQGVASIVDGQVPHFWPAIPVFQVVSTV